jgi:methionine aminopeptidase
VFHAPSVLQYATSRDKKPRKDEATQQPRLGQRLEPMINAGNRGADGGEVKLDKKDGWTVITRDGQLSAHFEHTVGGTGDGCEVFRRQGCSASAMFVQP